MQKLILILALVTTGLVGGVIGGYSVRTVQAQGTGYAAPRIFVNGNEVKPGQDGQIIINIRSSADARYPRLDTLVSDGFVSIMLTPSAQRQAGR